MNSGHVTERVYDELKRRLSTREFRPGGRLDPAFLSDLLGSSVTPVRDALNLLTGERLIEARTGEGFFMPHVTESDVRDLYAWNSDAVGVILRAVGKSAETERARPAAPPEPGALFAQLAERSANREHRRAIATINDRLSKVRAIEPAVLSNLQDEATALQQALTRTDPTETRRLIAAYHRRRFRAATDIVRALYGDS